MIREKISADVTSAIKGGRREEADALRMVMAGVILKDKESGKPATDDDVVQILKKAIKQRRESVDAFRKGAREDLASKEEREIGLLEKYLPAEMDDAAVRDAVAAIIAQMGGVGEKDLGKVMGRAMKDLKGKADGSRVQAAAKSLLGSPAK